MPNNKQGSSKKSSSADSKMLQVRSHSSSHHQQTRSQQGSSTRAKGAQSRSQQNSSHQQHRQQQPTIAQQHAKVLQQAKLLLAAAPAKAKAAASKCPPPAKPSPPKIRLVSPLEQLAQAQAQAQQALLQGQAEAQLRATPTPLLDGLLQQMASTEEQALDLVARLRLKVAALKRMRMHGYAAVEDHDGGEQQALDGPAKLEVRAEGEETKDTDRPEAEKETNSQEQVAKAEGEIEQVTRNTNKHADNRRDDQVTLSEEAEKEGIGDKKAAPSASPGGSNEGVSGGSNDDGAEAGPSKPGGRCTAQCSPRGTGQAQAQAQAVSHCRFPEAAMECLLRAAERGAQLTSSALKALRAAERQLMQEEASSGPWAPVVACGSEAKSRAARAEDACLCVEEALREVMRCFRAYGALESALPDFVASTSRPQPPTNLVANADAPAPVAQPRHQRSCGTSAVGGRKRRRKTESELQNIKYSQLHSAAVETAESDEIKKRQKSGAAEGPASSEGVPGKPRSSDGSHSGTVFRAEASATGSSGSSSSAPSAGSTGTEGSIESVPRGSAPSAWSTRSTGLASVLVGDVADSAVLTVARLLHRAIARCFPGGVKVTLAEEGEPPTAATAATAAAPAAPDPAHPCYHPSQRLVQQILQILNAGQPLPGSPESTDSDEAESLLAIKRKIIKEMKKAKKEKAEQAAKAAAVMQMPSLSSQKIDLGTSSPFGKKSLRKEDLIINVFEEKCRRLVVEAKTKAESSSPKSKRSEISEACKGEGPGDVVPDDEQLAKRRKDRERESGEDAAWKTKGEGEENEGTWCYLNNMATLLKTDSKIRFSLIESCAKRVSPLSTSQKSEKSPEDDNLLRTQASEFEKEENSVQYDNITSDLFIDGASLWKILSQNKNMKVSYQKLREATTELAMGVAGAWDLQEDKKDEQMEKFLQRQGARKKIQTVTPLLVELVEPVDLGETYTPPEDAKRGLEDNITKEEGEVKKQKYKLQLVKRDTDTGDAQCKDEARAKVVAAAIYQERTKRDRGETDVGTEDVAHSKALIVKEMKPIKEVRDEDAVSDSPARRATDSARRSAETGHPSERRERIKEVRDEDAVSDSPARRATDSARRSAEARHPSERGERIKEVRDEDAVSDSPARRATDSARRSAETGHPSERRERIKEVRDEDAVSDSPARRATDSARRSAEARHPSERGERIKEVRDEDAVSDSPARRATDSARRSAETGHPSERRERIKEVRDEDAVSDSPARRATDSARRSAEARHPSERGERIKEVRDEDAVSDSPARRATDSARRSAEGGHPSERGERIKEVRDEDAVSDSPARRATDSARRSAETGHPGEKAREGSPSSIEKAKEKEKQIARVEKIKEVSSPAERNHVEKKEKEREKAIARVEKSKEMSSPAESNHVEKKEKEKQIARVDKSKEVSSPVESKHAEKKNLEYSPPRVSKELVESSTKKPAPDTNKPKSPKAVAGPSVSDRSSPSGKSYYRLIRSAKAALAASPSRGYAKKPIKGRRMWSSPRRRSGWNSTSEDETECRPTGSAGRRKAQGSVTPRPAAAVTSQRPKASKSPRFKPPKPKSPPASEISIIKSKSHSFSESNVLRCASPVPAEIRATKSKSPAASELRVPRPSPPRTPEIQVIHYRVPDARRKQKSPVVSNMVVPKLKSPATSDVPVAKPKSPVLPGGRVSKLKSPTPSDGQMTKRSKSGQASKSPGGKSSSPVTSKDGKREAYLNASLRFWNIAMSNSPRRHENKSSNYKENASRKSFAPGKLLATWQLQRGRTNYTKSASSNKNKTSEKTTIYYENKTFKADKSAEKKSAGSRGKEDAEYDRRNKQKHDKNVSYKKQGPKVAKDGFAVLLNKGLKTPNSDSTSTIGEALSKGMEDSRRELYRNGSWKTISTDRNSMLVEHKSGVGEKTQKVVVEDALETVSLKKSVHKDTEREVTEEQGVQMTDRCVLQTEILNDEDTYQDVYDTSYDNEADIPVPKKVIVEECDFYEQFNQYQIEAIENIAPWRSNLVCDEYEFEEESIVEEEDEGEMIYNDPLINTEATNIPEEDVEDLSRLRKEIEEWIASFPPLGQRSDKEVAYIPGDLEAVPEYTGWDNVDRAPEAWEAEGEISPGWGYTWTDESSPKADGTADASMDEAFENIIRALTERHESRPPQTPSEGSDSEKAASEVSFGKERIGASNNSTDPFCSTCRNNKEDKTEGLGTQMPKQEEPFKDDNVDITKIVNALFNDSGMDDIEEESKCRCGEDDSDDESIQVATVSDFKSAENPSKEKIDFQAEDEARSPKEDFDDALINRLGEIRKTAIDRGRNEKIITEIMETLKKMKVYETHDDSPPEEIVAQPVQDDFYHRYSNLSMSPASDLKTSGILHLPSAESGRDTRKIPAPEGRTKLPFLFADSSKGLLAQFGAMKLFRAGARKSLRNTLSSSQRTICEIEEEEEPPEDGSTSVEQPRESTSKPQEPEERSHLGNALSKEEVDLDVQAADTEIMRVTEVVNAMKEAFKSKSKPGAKFTAEEVHDAIKRADEVIRKASAIERKLTDVIRSVASGERPTSAAQLRPDAPPSPSDPAARVPSCPPSGPSTGPPSRQGEGPRAAAEAAATEEGGAGGAAASPLAVAIAEDDADADADGELSELPSDASEIFSESGSGASLSDSSDSRPPSSDSSLQECEGSAAPAALAAFRLHLARDGLALQLRPVADCPHAHAPSRAYRPRHRAAATLLGVSVEASGANEEAAERRATLVLAAELARRQVEGCLPPQLTPFADDELLQLAALARREAGSSGAETWLRAECQRRGRSPPRFAQLPPPPSDGAAPAAVPAPAAAGWGGERPAHAVRCTALDLVAYGTGAHRQSARRAAAHEMLELLERQRVACDAAPHLGSNLVLLP